jgi:hypothetical protein
VARRLRRERHEGPQRTKEIAMLQPTRRLSTLGLSILLAGLVGVSTVRAQEPASAPWTTVGSAGTVDEAHLSNVALGSPVSGAVSISAAGTVNIRYNVVAVAGVLGGNGLTLTARYQTSPAPLENSPLFSPMFFFPGFGTPGQVIVRLMKYNLTTGVVTNLLTLDSNSFPQASGFQVQSVATSACVPPFTTLDFVNNSYFMDVALIKPSGGLRDTTISGPSPALAMIKLVNNAGCIL